MKTITQVALLVSALVLVGCDKQTPIATNEDANDNGNSAATSYTAAANANVLEQLPFSDKQDFADAQRGFIATDENLSIAGPNGKVIWQPAEYGFITGDAPASANPSLWRQAMLNNIHGLFKVSEHIYQVRGYDLANMSIIEGDKGWILVDPLTAKETAKAALDLVNKHLGERPVTAVIFTHSHIDHFGGVLGVTTPEQIASGQTEIIAPVGFVEESVSEMIIAGNTMTRRSTFSYGKNLPRNERGHIGSGLGKAPAYGLTGIAQPTTIIDTTGQTLTVDGIEIVFQNAAGSEAPAELMFYLPQLKAFCGAEVLSRNMHNIYTLRGAKVRDSKTWASYIDESIDLFGGEAENYFASHHWPLWGNDNIVEYLEKQRDMYKYIHDQTLRLANRGLTPKEIAEQIEMPDSLSKVFYNRGYYGTLKHNAKAVYQYYFGWYDGNPANLDDLPPVQSAKKYVELMGGNAAVVEAAQTAFDNGEYRWVAQLLNHAVFADPNDGAAKALLANAYDQLGYQAESGVWRDVYLNAAQELRHGIKKSDNIISNARDFLVQAPVSDFFDALAVRLNGMEADGEQYTINITISDKDENHVLSVKNSVLHHRIAPKADNANASITISHELLIDMLTGNAGLRETLTSDQLDIEGSTLDLLGFFSLFDQLAPDFPIVTP